MSGGEPIRELNPKGELAQARGHRRMSYRALRTSDPANAGGRAVDLQGALIFAVLVTAVSVGAALIERETGAAGALIAAAVADFADAHAAPASLASMHAARQMCATLAMIGVLTCMRPTRSPRPCSRSRLGRRATGDRW